MAGQKTEHQTIEARVALTIDTLAYFTAMEAAVRRAKSPEEREEAERELRRIAADVGLQIMRSVPGYEASIEFVLKENGGGEG